MSEPSKIANCPFCGSHASAMHDYYDHHKWMVDCASCNGSMSSATSKDEAIDLWNHRPDSAMRVALEAGMKAMHDLTKTLSNRIYRDNEDIRKDVCCRAQVAYDGLAALAVAQDSPQYSESALDRFAEAGAKAWAKVPEDAKKLIQQVEARPKEEVPYDYRTAEAVFAKVQEWTEQGLRFHPTDIWQTMRANASADTDTQKDGERLDWSELANRFEKRADELWERLGLAGKPWSDMYRDMAADIRDSARSREEGKT